MCSIIGLTYTGNSCYQDTVLISLLAIPNKFIDREIVNKDIDKISSDEKREIKCSEYSIKNDRIRRSKIKKEIIKIMNSMRNKGEKVETCSMLREYIKDCPSLGGQEFHETGTQDAGEFLLYLFSLFNIEKTTTRYIQNIATNDLKNKVSELETYIVSSYREELVSPIVSIHSNSLIDTNIDYYLNFEDDTIFGEKDTYVASDNKKYKRKIMYDLIKDSQYLIFKIERLTGNNVRKYNRIVPNESIVLQSDRKLYLHSIIVHKSTHYTCYIKCENSWFYYNDMGNTFEYIGSYKDMIENKQTSDKIRPDPCTMSTLCFYSLKE